MIDTNPVPERSARIQGAGLPESVVRALLGNLDSLRIAPGGDDTATYACEQAFCRLSDQLVHNLERYWKAREPRL